MHEKKMLILYLFDTVVGQCCFLLTVPPFAICSVYPFYTIINLFSQFYKMMDVVAGVQQKTE